MSDRYITLPAPAQFLDSYTKELVKVRDEEGNMVDHPERTFDWFMHVFVLSHLQFSMDVGGYEAAKAGKEIAKAMEKAMDAGEAFFAVSADNWRRLNCCFARPDDKHADERMKEKPNTKILAKSSHGLTRPLDNFTASCFMDHMDAIANASTNKPEIVAAVPVAPASAEELPAPAN